MTLKETLIRWLTDTPGIFHGSELKEGVHLVELATGKERTILYPQVIQWRRKTHSEGSRTQGSRTQGLGDYFNLVFEDQRELVLCHAGFAFAPSFLSTGPIEGLPQVLCFQDFHRFKGHLDHLYQDPSQTKEALRTLMSCMALLEGARLVGLDISDEERSLEPILEWLEKH